jgi:hypothetical protein
MKQPNVPCEELEGWISEQPVWTVAGIQTYFQLVMTLLVARPIGRALRGLQLEREGITIIKSVGKKLCEWVAMEWIQLAVAGCFEQGSEHSVSIKLGKYMIS